MARINLLRELERSQPVEDSFWDTDLAVITYLNTGKLAPSVMMYDGSVIDLEPTSSDIIAVANYLQRKK